MPNFADLHTMYQGNVTPAMVEVLAKQLGVTAKSLTRLGVGYWPAEGAWMFPERDAEGQIIGLIRRYHKGEKFCVKESKRGLTYAVTEVTDGYDPSRQTWERVRPDYPCPICGGTKWCGVDGNATPPRFVRCMRIEEDSCHTDRHGGFIHERVPGAFKPPQKYRTPLAESPYPILIVEGQTDVATGLDLCFEAVGRPSAKGGLRLLGQLVHGRSVAVIGENDSGVGRLGMESTFQALRARCPDVVKLMPPSEFKDLREWRQRGGLTTETLLAAIETGDRDSADTILEDKAPLAIAELWLRQEQMLDGLPILRKFKGEWFRWNGECYEVVDEDTELRGPLYRFLSDKSYKSFTPSGECAIKKYDAKRSNISDIVDALNMSCPVRQAPPCWLDDRPVPATESIVVFKNGILDVDAYLHGGRVHLIPSTPLLFHTAAVPYEFDSTATCPAWLKFLNEVFISDAERIALLQEWFGYCLVADSSMEKLMLMVGRPGSGKSTSLEVLQAVLGSHQCAKSSFKDLCSEFGLQPLRGKLAIILPDAHVPRQVDAMQALEKIKAITGRDGVTVNRKFLPQMPDEHLPGRFTIAVNELPELPDHARSLERRLLLLHFPETFEGREDRTLKDRLPQEAPGILIWALEGLRRLRESSKFTAPKSSVPVIEEFRRFLTPVAEFLDECCEIGPGADYWMLKDQAYDAWSMWAKERGLRPGVRSRFGQRLMAQNPTFVSGRRSLRGRQERVYAGVRLTPNAKDRYLARAR